MNIREQVEMKLMGRREKNAHDSIRKKNAVLSKYPEIVKLESDARDYMVGAMTGGEINTKYFDELIEKKEALIDKYGIREDLKPIHDCYICGDRGYLEDGSMCKCLKTLLEEEYFRVGESSNIIKNATFENFKLDIFSEQIMPGNKISLRNYMSEKLEEAKAYAESFTGTGKGLLYFGKSGTGKTFTTGAIANRIRERGFTVLYMTAVELMDAVKEKDYSKNADDSETKYQLIKDVDLLVIDDLGTELATPYTASALFDIVNYRSGLEKPVIYSTNFELSQLSKRYHDRIFSRITGSVKLVEYFGNNIRYIKKGE